jgi:hypothetical protein
MLSKKIIEGPSGAISGVFVSSLSDLSDMKSWNYPDSEYRYSLELSVYPEPDGYPE